MKRIAIVAQAGSTGGWRYVMRLCEGIQTVRPDIELVIYTSKSVIHSVSQGKTNDSSAPTGIRLRRWYYASKFFSRLPFRQIAGRAIGLNFVCRYFYERQRAELNKFDLVFFAWPYHIECPDLAVPVAFIPHDFNYMHFFGAVIYPQREYRNLKVSHHRWINIAHPVVSSRFIAFELQRLTNRTLDDASIIPLSRLSPVGRRSDDEAKKILTKLGISGDYVLCANNMQYHKNVGSLLSAFHAVTLRCPGLQLILCGPDTEQIRGVSSTDFYIDNCDENWNVIGLGLVSDLELVALIQCARLVINPSLYEAGNGSGLDAWALGTPVAMSNIPAFVEHIDVLGVRAGLFNPRCSHEIADAIVDLLQNPDKAETYAALSKEAIDRYGWDKVATKYLEFFSALTQRHSKQENLSL